MESARFLGRLLRRKGEWDEAVRWYEGARAAARVEGDRTTEAVVLDGWASTMVDRGNLPSARALLHEGLTAANESGSDWAVASIHHTLMRVERLSRRLPQAVAHGWRAVTLFPQEDNRYAALVSLAACFVEMRELDAAEDSYTIVLERVDRPDQRFAAFEMLAHISALRGDRAEFEQRLERVEHAGWRERASTPVHAQILRDRGLSWKALGDREAARLWLTRARDYAQEHGVNQVYFECDQAISDLENARATPVSAHFDATEVAPSDPIFVSADLAEIRDGVGALRRELVSV